MESNEKLLGINTNRSLIAISKYNGYLILIFANLFCQLQFKSTSKGLDLSKIKSNPTAISPSSFI